jgi:hypothetical protein
VKSRTKRILLLIGLFCVVFGAKVIAISHYGSNVPQMDQWDAEPELVYLPFLDGQLSLKLLFASHNEHRIFFTRLLSLALLLAAGEWNPILQMIVGAILNSTAVVLLAWAFARDLPEHDLTPFVFLCALTFSLPIANENMLGGFQSHFYFLLLFSTASFILILRSETLPGWAAGTLAAAASYVSLASGALTFFVAGAILVLRSISERSISRRKLLLVGILMSGGIICLMFFQRPPGVEILQPHSFSQFMSALIWLGGFPFSTVVSMDKPLAVRALISLFAVFPVLVLVTVKMTSRRDGSGWLALAVSAFVFVNIVSIAYNRAEGFNAPRYFDILLLMMPAGFVALSVAGMRHVFRALWLFGAVASLVYFAATNSFPALALHKQLSDRQLQNVRDFVATGASLEGKAFLDIPYPVPKRLESLLSSPPIRALLPSEIRPNDQGTEELHNRFFPRPGLYRLTKGAEHYLLAWAPLILAAGAGLLGMTLIRFKRC